MKNAIIFTLLVILLPLGIIGYILRSIQWDRKGFPPRIHSVRDRGLFT